MLSDKITARGQEVNVSFYFERRCHQAVHDRLSTVFNTTRYIAVMMIMIKQCFGGGRSTTSAQEAYSVL